MCSESEILFTANSVTEGTKTMTVNKTERSIPVLRPKNESELGLTVCVTRSGINCWIELYGCSLTLPVMCWV